MDSQREFRWLRWVWLSDRYASNTDINVVELARFIHRISCDHTPYLVQWSETEIGKACEHFVGPILRRWCEIVCARMQDQDYQQAEHLNQNEQALRKYQDCMQFKNQSLRQPYGVSPQESHQAPCTPSQIIRGG